MKGIKMELTNEQKEFCIKIINQIDEELKWTTNHVVNGKAKKELIEAFKEGEKVGYKNGIDKLIKIKDYILELI